MQLFIRNRARYNPEMPDNGLISMKIENYADTCIRQLKENAKRQRALKMGELFHFSAAGMQRLEDGRTVAHYNLVDGDILESTSNPFFAACMYILAIDATRKYNSNEGDQRMQSLMKKSYIRKYTIIGILFNSSKDSGDTQPPNFKSVDDFITFIKNHPKKGAEMSPFTERALWDLWKQYTTIDIRTQDPVRSLVSRYRDRLELQGNGNPDIDPDDYDSGYEDRNDANNNRGFGRRQGRQPIAVPPFPLRRKASKPKSSPKSTVSQGVKKRKKEPRYCDNCANNQEASVWCPECDGGQGFALCEMCTIFLHSKRKHNTMGDINQAPKTSKQYIPHAYRAPFALLVGLFSGHTKEPKKISMTEDELREVAQGLTDTDLYDKSPGKIFGGFDSIDNLITKDLVKREATEKPTYALKQSGIDLGKRLLKFHSAVRNILRKNNVPTVPHGKHVDLVLGESVLTLVIDEMERKKTRMAELTQKRGLETEVRNLPAGDYLWLLKINGNEMVLPCIVERKTWDDLQSSVQDNRFFKQVDAMKRLGYQNKFYLLEGNIGDMRGKPTEQQKDYLQDCLIDLVLNKFKVNYTGSWFKTAEWLTQLTHILALAYKQGQIGALMPYTEYARLARTLKPVSAEQRIPVYHHWNADDYVEVITGRTNAEQPYVLERVHERLNVDVPLPLEHHLLVIQGLETYNKGRQKLLNDSLSEAFSDMTRPVKDLVRPLLSETHLLVHYDVQQYYSLCMQVMLNIFVVRKGNTDDIAMLKQQFIGEQKLPNYTQKSVPRENLALGNKTLSSSKDIDQQFATPDNNEDEALQQALALSLRDTEMRYATANLVQKETSENMNDDKDFQRALALSLIDSGNIKQEKEMQIKKDEYYSDDMGKDDEDYENDDMRLAMELSLKENSMMEMDIVNKKDQDLVKNPTNTFTDTSNDEFIAKNLQQKLMAKDGTDSPVKDLINTFLETQEMMCGLENDAEYARKVEDELNKSDCKTGEKFGKKKLAISEDELFARKLQDDLNKEEKLNNSSFKMTSPPDFSNDVEIARKLQKELDSNDSMLGSGRMTQLENTDIYSSNYSDTSPNTSTLIVKRQRIDEQRKTFGTENGITRNKAPETYTPTSVREANVYGAFRNMKHQQGELNSQLESYRKSQHERYRGNDTAYSSQWKPDKSFNYSTNYNATQSKQSSAEAVYIDSDSDEDVLSRAKRRLQIPEPEPKLTNFNRTSSTYQDPLEIDDLKASSQERQGNMKCGACKGIGHNRRWKYCPMYYTDEEMKKREQQKTAYKEKREQEEKRQQEAITALEAHKNSMVNQLQDTIGNISTLIGSIKKKKPKKK